MIPCDPIDRPPLCQRGFLSLFCSEQLGTGQGRYVYEYGPDPQRLVIKVETGSGSFQNIVEWETWTKLSDGNSKWLRWFAPCLRISSCGTVLIQERTQPLNRKIPMKVPDLFCDMKRGNFGWIGNRFVCHDYGWNLFGWRAAREGRLVIPRWWEGDNKAW